MTLMLIDINIEHNRRVLAQYTYSAQIIPDLLGRAEQHSVAIVR